MRMKVNQGIRRLWTPANVVRSAFPGRLVRRANDNASVLAGCHVARRASGGNGAVYGRRALAPSVHSRLRWGAGGAADPPAGAGAAPRLLSPCERRSHSSWARRLWAPWLICLLWAALPTSAGPPAGSTPPARPLPNSPYLQSELAVLMDAVTLQMSFDNRSMTPDMSAAESDLKPRVFGPYSDRKAPPEFTAGLIGDGLILGTGVAMVATAGTVDFAHQGAVALWVKPLEWKRPNGSNCVFVMSSAATFYMQRQGPAVGKDGKVRRHENIQFLAKARKKDKRFTGITGGNWENGKWYFMVASWSWPNMTLSINGSPLRTKALRGKPEDSRFGNLMVGAGGGDRALLDELLVFSRPLSLEETRLLYKMLRPQEDE
ncbi:MAG: hypothetical protein HOJ57_25870 [Lentisphaerae bacterium]|jgi:hypothetical protein|nr:hypothetical protein [Lentisphaerota bacterium]MBT5609395.1 hypothetical protein [Lentisphaerota bacterium]